MNKRKKRGNSRFSKYSFRGRVILISVGVGLGLLSFIFMANMVQQLRVKEQLLIEIWAHAVERVGYVDINDPLFMQVMSRNSNIPFLIVNEELQVRASNLVPARVINHPDQLMKRIDKFNRSNPPIRMINMDGSTLYMFYGTSQLLNLLTYFPLVQFIVMLTFLLFAYITFSSSKHDEQNSVWIGLAKETAHQLGTPTSSLLGWIEYLRTQPVEQFAVDDMEKDIIRLTKVVDRFSKIGSETVLSMTNINELVGDSIIYFRSRSPKNVTIEYNGLAMAPLFAMANGALFEWVVENLLKNALDALQGRGEIDVALSGDENDLYIDVKDSGKGIAKGNFKRIFDPGFSTKTRGWGLGLSLSERIIEEYHNGKIFVLESEPGRGATIRIVLKRGYP